MKKPFIHGVFMSKSDKNLEVYMKLACDLALENAISGKGGPFGAVIVKSGEIIATGVNQVTSSNDPTAHAEIVAIRNACTVLKSFQLTECEIYTSCEPCPMCLGAIFWARPQIVYFANSAGDAAAIDFDDSFIYEQIKISHEHRSIPFQSVSYPEALEAFKVWKSKQNKVNY